MSERPGERSGPVRGIDWKSVAVAIAAAGAGFWILRPAAADTIEARVATLAARMHDVAPRPLDDGSTLAGVRADGRTIVLAIAGQAPWRPGHSDAAMTALRAADLCGQEELRALVDAGAKVRIEATTAAGARLPVLLVESCGPDQPVGIDMLR